MPGITLVAGVRAPLGALTPAIAPLPAADANVAATLAEVEQAVVFLQSASQSGSGFVVSETVILTSAHVVAGVDDVSIWYSNGARGKGRVAATDPGLDVAAILVESLPAGIRALDWQSAPTPGLAAPMWAWGFPLESALLEAGFSRAPTVSVGIVSAVRWRDGHRFLQTDAAINLGSSGGPVVAADGRVVGISTSILTPEGQDPEGLNFALDVARHRNQLQQLISRAADSPGKVPD